MRASTSLVVFLLLFHITSLPAGDIYISPDVGSASPNSHDKHFQSLEKALSLAGAGDTLWLCEGRYKEQVNLVGKNGIRIRPVDNAHVVLDGTVEIPKAWQPWQNGIWKQQLDINPHQLFLDDNLVYLARWPNANFEDGSIWRMMRGMRSAEGGWNKHKQMWEGRSRLGLLYDDSFHYPETPGFREGDSRYQIDPEINFKEQPESLAQSGYDFKDCIVVLNVGHWQTWARRITDHKPNQDHFSYDPSGLTGTNIQQFSAYHILGLAALDRSNEWWFDSATKTIYYKPPDELNPNLLNLRGRTRDFGIRLDRCSDIKISGLHVHASGFWVKNCTNVAVHGCTFDYPATHRFLEGNFKHFVAWNPASNSNTMPSFFGGNNNVFYNSTIRFCNAPIFFGSEDMRVENCLFSDIEWEVNSNGGSGAVMIGKGGTFRRNTLRRCGNSEGLRAVDEGTTIVLNRLSNMSNLQHDGSAINVGTTKHHKAVVSHNWVHDCNRQGIRFDYHGSGICREDGSLYGDGVYKRNVTWNTTDNEIKGDRHLILNNTILRNNHYPNVFQEPVTMSVQGFFVMHEINGNANSLTRNNLGTIRSRSFHLEDSPRPWWKRSNGTVMPVAEVLPGQSDHNNCEPGAAWKYLRDPANHDFRPKAGSPLVDAGLPVKPHELPSPDLRFSQHRYVGSAPDIGAYEFADKRYWIPGRLEHTASNPIPRNGGENVPLNADLMFLEANQSSEHTIYFGNHPQNLQVIAILKDNETNIVTPPKLVERTTYYWQVGAKSRFTTETISPTWKFTTGE